MSTTTSAQALLVRGFRQTRNTLQRYTRPNYWEGPAGSQEFLASAAINYPGTINVETQIVSYSVPPGYIGRLRWLSLVHIGGNPPDGTGSVIWRLRINGACVNGFSNLQFQLGNAVGGAFQSPGYPVSSVELNQGDVITATVTVTALQVGGVSTAAQLHGWVVSATAQGGTQ